MTTARNIIYKESVAPGTTFSIVGEVVHFDCIDNNLFVWFIAGNRRDYSIVGTGWDYSSNLTHVATAIQDILVWHLLAH